MKAIRVVCLGGLDCLNVIQTNGFSSAAKSNKKIDVHLATNISGPQSTSYEL